MHLKVGCGAGRTVEHLPAKRLTKRRAVDFCRVATALCPVVPPTERASAAH
ncbi:MAG: putative leader peptide [Micromonosporaceae bacterium]